MIFISSSSSSSSSSSLKLHNNSFRIWNSVSWALVSSSALFFFGFSPPCKCLVAALFFVDVIWAAAEFFFLRIRYSCHHLLLLFLLVRVLTIGAGFFLSIFAWRFWLLFCDIIRRRWSCGDFCTYLWGNFFVCLRGVNMLEKLSSWNRRAVIMIIIILQRLSLSG